MDKDLVVGIDSSTTACKALVWDRKGQLISQGAAGIRRLNPREGWHEQVAAEWWEALAESLRIAMVNVDTRRLAGMCVCAQRETFVPVNAAGEAIRNAILWMDVRASGLMVDLESSLGRREFHRLTGKPLSGNLTLLKIEWLRRNEPLVWEDADRFLDVAAFLNQRLTGVCATGWGIAGPAGLLDLDTHGYAAAVLGFLGLEAINLPDLYPTGALIGSVTTQAAFQTGLPAGLPVTAGIGDGQAGGLGLGIIQPGATYLSLGTSVVSGTYADRFLTSEAFRTMIAPNPGSYFLETVILGGTFTLDWFLGNFCQGITLETLEAEARQLPPGAGGLLLLPYWNSVLNPYWDPAASGLVIGWRGHHGRLHFYRAILEGIAFEMRLHFEGVETELGRRIERVVVTGGGANSELWCQILADVTGAPVQRSTTAQATALGAGMIAAAGVGLFPDFKRAADQMAAPIQDEFTPQPEAMKAYSYIYRDVYRDLFPAVQDGMRRLAVATGEISTSSNE